MVDRKVCTRCRIEKPAEDFHRSKRHTTGLQSKCKACQRELDAAWWEAKGREAAKRLASREKVVSKRKTCSTCGRRRSPSAFHKLAASRDGYAYECKECAAERNKRWAERHPEEMRHSARERARRYHLRWTYGITVEQYEEMLAHQDALCALCHRPERRKIRGSVTPLSVDHDHATGRIRGLLCSACNLEVGRIEKILRTPEHMTRTIAYLDSNKDVSE